MNHTLRRAANLATIAIVAAVGGVIGSNLINHRSAEDRQTISADFTSTLAKRHADCLVLGEEWCSHCQDAGAYLRQRNVTCATLQISTDKEAQDLYASLGRPGFPILVTRDRATIGFSPPIWEGALREVSSR